MIDLLRKVVRADPRNLDTLFSSGQGLPSSRVPSLDAWTDSNGFLPRPDLRWDRVQKQVACFRPCRPEGPRIELEHLNFDGRNTNIMHLTGLGGSGVSLAWGAALEGVNIFESKIPESDRRGAEVAVIGSGIVGLCTAFILQERNYEVHIYSHLTEGEIPSSQAGALFSPEYSSKEASRDPMIRARDERIRRHSIMCLRALLGDHFQGIEYLPVFLADLKQDKEDWLWKQEITLSPLPDFVQMKRLPFQGVEQSGTLRWTIRFDMPAYLKALRDVVVMRSPFKAFLSGMVLGVSQHLETPDLCPLIREPHWFNCTGGLDPLFPDPSAFPIRGLLLLLESQTLPYAFYHMDGYGIPRADCLVLGGTYEERESNPNPPEELFRDILDRNRAFFGLKA